MSSESGPYPSATLCGPIVMVSIAAADLDASLAAYSEAFALTQQAFGVVSDEVAAHWHAPDLAGRRWAILGCGGSDHGSLRFIETGDATAAPLASLGWAAAELSVLDADAVQARACTLGFDELGAVRQLGSTPAIRAGQVAGPEGAALYITDVAAYEGALDLSAATGDGACFIAVLATADLEADRAWLVDQGLAHKVTDREVAVPVLKDTLGVEALRISSVQLAGGCLIEIDGYPADTPMRETALGLPAGVAMVTVLTHDIAGTVLADAPYNGRSARIDRLPGGALLERIAL